MHNTTINDLSKLIDLIDVHGLQLKLNQDRRGYRIESPRGRLITPILNSNQCKLHLETILNAINEMSNVRTG